ncbi:MAG: hypothetical protein WBH75_07610 [Thermoanaerobaculia bacterium]
MMNTERRRLGRREVDGIDGSLYATSDAKIVDISVDGLSSETTRSLRVGLQIPLSLGWRRRAMPLQGEVIWCALVGTWRNELSDVLPVYRAGVRFEWEQKDGVTDLCKFLEENALITLDQAIYGRFKVHSPTLAKVEFLAGFAVKRIGLSGMLAEIDFAPEVGSALDIQLLVGERTFEAKGSIAGVKRIEWKSNIPLALVEVKMLGLSVEAREILEEFLRQELTRRSAD